MKITRIKVTKLFGKLNPDIKINSNIKIIYGKNGSGKTTLLRILNAILSGSLHELKSIKFQTVTCYFDDGHELLISKANDNKKVATQKNQFDKKNLILSLNKNEKELHSEFIPYNSNATGELHRHIDFIDDEIPELERVGRTEWRNMETGAFLSLDDIIEIYGYKFPWINIKHKTVWYRDFISKFEVKFIQTQRLLTYIKSIERSKYARPEPRIGYESTVEKYSIELRNLIRDKFSESAQLGQGLDSSFPKRLLDKDATYKYDENTIIDLVNKLETLRNKLENAGLIKQQNVITIDAKSMSNTDQKAIYLYLNDTLKKLKVFEDLERKISLFTSILNKKFDGNKTISFSKEKGFEVFTTEKETLDPRLLSSGEQHEIILLYDLIFKASKNMLVLIDEPEISLHLDWQLSFLSDLESISELNNPQFVIATHSPSIIGNKINLSQEIEA